MTVKFVLAVLCMAAVTYFTRVFGYLVLHDRKLSPTVQKLMEASPGCVLISVVAPYFAKTNPADLAGLAVAVLAAAKLNFFLAVVTAIAAGAAFRNLLPLLGV